MKNNMCMVEEILTVLSVFFCSVLRRCVHISVLNLVAYGKSFTLHNASNRYVRISKERDLGCLISVNQSMSADTYLNFNIFFYSKVLTYYVDQTVIK